MKLNLKFSKIDLAKISEIVAKRFTYLKHNLAQAGIALKGEDFVKRKLKEALIVAVTLPLSTALIITKMDAGFWPILPAFLFFYIIVFLFLMNTPKAIANRKIREIDMEITYAGRFLLIELSAGVPLFDAIKNVSLNFEYIGKHFREILQRVEFGKPIEQSLNEVMEITPSDNFRKVLFSIVNSLKTGADISIALNSVIEQISREKLIKIKEYGKKLNPVVMFYLIIAVIAPSLGVAVLTLLSSFLGLTFSLGSLLGISFGVGLLQLIFISVIDTLRRGV